MRNLCAKYVSTGCGKNRPPRQCVRERQTCNPWTTPCHKPPFIRSSRTIAGASGAGLSQNSAVSRLWPDNGMAAAAGTDATNNYKNHHQLECRRRTASIFTLT